MLTKFEVTNFKNFKNKLVFDFTESKQYGFNQECVINDIINKALVYGHNGTGKSNLGFAIFDLVSHLTDKHFNKTDYKNYLSADGDRKYATFRYEFQLQSGQLTYEYSKSNIETLIHEKIEIDGEEYASIDRSKSLIAKFYAKGAETLDGDMEGSKASIISYLNKNSVLKKNSVNACFDEFIDFVNGMLFFRSLGNNEYIGFQQGTGNISNYIIENNNIDHFQNFLNEAGIDCKIGIMDENEKKIIAFEFGEKQIPFFDIASKGTLALSLFYYWYQHIKDSETGAASFIFIDEFDAFYHHTLSAFIIEKLREIKPQVVVTTHNTSIITNELLRPDCYFLLTRKGISSLANNTAKELREANNIEKMYRAGAFDG